MNWIIKPKMSVVQARWQIYKIKRKIARMGTEGYKPGGSSKPAHLYSPLPFPEFDDIPWQREACYERFEMISKNIPAGLTGSGILDIGTHTGFHAFKLAALGYHCTGLDLDALSIEIARDVAALYKLDINFLCTEASPEAIEQLGHFDVCLFLATFQWIVARHGFEYAQDVLKTAMRRSDVLFFETSMGDEGRAKMPMLPDENAVRSMLLEQGVHREVLCLGEVVAPNAWLQKKRYLFRTSLASHDPA